MFVKQLGEKGLRAFARLNASEQDYLLTHVRSEEGIRKLLLGSHRSYSLEGSRFLGYELKYEGKNDFLGHVSEEAIRLLDELVEMSNSLEGSLTQMIKGVEAILEMQTPLNEELGEEKTQLALGAYWKDMEEFLQQLQREKLEESEPKYNLH